MAHFSTNIPKKTKIIMKTFISSLLVSVGLLLTSFTAQNGIDDVINALRSGNAADISRYIDGSVDISLPDKSDNYSKAQAVVILKDFFSSNGVKNFELKHKGDQGGREFCIGTLQTREGNFRTTVFMKPKANKQVVSEIRFQPLD
jgi:hypothetical protein